MPPELINPASADFENRQACKRRDAVTMTCHSGKEDTNHLQIS